MVESPFTSRLAAARQRAGLTQQHLATRVGVSRQALGQIEAGRTVPSTALALGLGAQLGCRVEDLFSIGGREEGREIQAVWAGDADPAPRAVVAHIGGRWVAHPIDARESRAADACMASGQPRLRFLSGREPEDARDRLLISGCAPALGVLADHLGRRRHGVAASWLHATSAEALRQLAAHQTHVAGVHEITDQPARSVRRSRPGGQARRQILTFAHWQEGLLVRRGDRRAPRRLEDLHRRDFRLAEREAGASATQLLQRAAAAIGLRVAGTRVPVRGHMGVAQAVALGAADVGVAALPAALAFDLDFVPLAVERFDLVFDTAGRDDPRLARLGDLLASAGFRRDLESVGGYDARATGMRVEKRTPA